MNFIVILIFRGGKETRRGELEWKTGTTKCRDENINNQKKNKKKIKRNKINSLNENIFMLYWWLREEMRK